MGRADGCPMCRALISLYFFPHAVDATTECGTEAPPLFVSPHEAAVSNLEHADGNVRCTALRRIDVTRCAPVVDALVRRLTNDDDLRVRLAAAVVVRLLPSEMLDELLAAFGGIDRLRRVIHSDESVTRKCAVHILQQLAQTGGDGALEAAVALSSAGLPISADHDGPASGMVGDLRAAIAEASPYMAKGEYARCNAIFRAAAEQHASTSAELREAIHSARTTTAQDERWVAFNIYRRAFDSVIVLGHNTPNECFLYFWDDRDGQNWMGWWITPEDVGCTRYWAYARGCDTDSPVECHHWEMGGTKIPLTVKRKAQGALELCIARAQPGMVFAFLGVYEPINHPHDHKGRPVYRRVIATESPILGERRLSTCLRSMSCLLM